MAAKTSHIEVAVADGMKAGLRAYMGSLASSGLPQVQERYDMLNELSGRKAFQWYCDMFGAKVEKGRKGTSTTGTSKAREVVARLRPSTPKNETEVERLKRELAQAEKKAEGEAREIETTKRNAPTGPQIKLIERIAYRKGDTVDITVKLNGKALSFDAGSKYIEDALANGVIKFRNR